MGGDSFKDITMWREYERILSEYDVIVAMRPGIRPVQDPAAHLAGHLQKRAIDLRDGVRPPEKLPAGAHIYLTDYVEIDVSSTDVREFAAQGRGIDDLVPAPVAAYIAKYNLYQNSECQKS
jgi:nicotinate-nucleotide adenylyltransferase